MAVGAVTFPNFATTTQTLFTEKTSTPAKLLSIVAKWLNTTGLAPRAKNPVVAVMGNVGDLTRWAFAPAKLVGNTYEAGDRAVQFFDDPSCSRFATILPKVASIAGPVEDGMKLLNLTKIVDLQGPSDWFGHIGGPCLVLSQGYTAAEHLGNVADSGFIDAQSDKQVARAFYKVSMGLIEMAKAIAHVVTGVFVILTAFFGVLLPIPLLVAGTFNLALTIFGHYYKNLGKPA